MLSKQLQDQIEQEAIDGTKVRAENAGDVGWNQGYERGYEAAGEKYAEKLHEAQQLVDRYEKALKQIEQMSDPGDYFKAICDMKAIASKALTPKTGSDDR